MHFIIVELFLSNFNASWKLEILIYLSIHISICQYNYLSIYLVYCILNKVDGFSKINCRLLNSFLHHIFVDLRIVLSTWPIGSAVSAFIWYKQANKSTDKKIIYLWSVFYDHILIFYRTNLKVPRLNVEIKRSRFTNTILLTPVSKICCYIKVTNYQILWDY